jgi:hypothetical protein
MASEAEVAIFRFIPNLCICRKITQIQSLRLPANFVFVRCLTEQPVITSTCVRIAYESWSYAFARATLS